MSYQDVNGNSERYQDMNGNSESYQNMNGNSESSPQDSQASGSGDSQSTLASTQPFDEETAGDPGSPHAAQSWSYLTSLSSYYSTCGVHQSVFVVGRNQSCDYRLCAPLIPNDCISQFSRFHFEIQRQEVDDDYDVFLIDKSTTGTFVNGEMVGKGNKRPLLHGDVISMRSKTLEAFRFDVVRAELATGSDAKEKLPKAVKDKYVIGKELGKGSSGTVYLGYLKAAPYTKLAVKVVNKVAHTTGSYGNVLNEAAILRTLDHPCIIKVLDVVDSDDSFVIVLELAKGGELFDYVLEDFEKNTFNERIAKLQFYQILCGVEYLHRMNVCHRDIKLENILMACKSKVSLIKITDFGLSKLLDASTMMTSFVGTMTYIAPEVLRNSNCETSAYTMRADMWSLGCILFSLLCGSPAFYGNSDDELQTRILTCEYHKDPDRWGNITYDAHDLLGQLLRRAAAERISAENALKHPWFANDPVVVREAKNLMLGRQINMDSFSVVQLSNEVGTLAINDRRGKKRSADEGVEQLPQDAAAAKSQRKSD